MKSPAGPSTVILAFRSQLDSVVFFVLVFFVLDVQLNCGCDESGCKRFYMSMFVLM